LEFPVLNPAPLLLKLRRLALVVALTIDAIDSNFII